jgi:hypothetical protein
MEFLDEQLIAHSVLRDKVRAYARKPDGSLQPDTIRAQDRCALGHWLKDKNDKLGSRPEYRELKENHERFHVAAAEAVALADRSQPEAEVTVEADGFRMTFGYFIRALVLARGTR